MLTCCNTTRGRVACGLGGVLIAALAVACLWAFSPAVTAGDDVPPKSASKAKCPEEPGLPPVPTLDKKSDAVLPPTPPPPPPAPVPPKPDFSNAPPPPDLPPMTVTGKPAPPPVPPGPVAPVSDTGPATPPVPPADTHDIKQFVAQLSTIRAERTRLDERERQTVQTIKQKYQEQKRALEQLDRELRQLGINCDETPPPQPDGPVPSPLPTVRSR